MKKRNNFYRDKVVYKPWGYEYVVYSSSNRLAITFLKINYGHKTSLHCHPKKKTGFIILSGKALVQIGIYKKNSKRTWIATCYYFSGVFIIRYGK